MSWTPCESCPARFDSIRMSTTDWATSSGVPAALNSASATLWSRWACTYIIVDLPCSEWAHHSAVERLEQDALEALGDCVARQVGGHPGAAGRTQLPGEAAVVGQPRD